MTNTKKTKIKNLEQTLDSQKYDIKEKSKITQIIKCIYMKFALKLGIFFKVILGYKNEN